MRGEYSLSGVFNSFHCWDAKNAKVDCLPLLSTAREKPTPFALFAALRCGPIWEDNAVQYKKLQLMRLLSYSNPSSRLVHHNLPVLGILNIPT